MVRICIYLSILGQILAFVTLTNHIITKKNNKLKIFSFMYRLGTNFSWRGRQTICQLPKSNQIESEKLLQIRAASSLQDFRRLLCNNQTNEPYRTYTTYDQCLTQFQTRPSTANASCNPVSCTKQVCQRNEVRSDLAYANTFYDDIDTVPPAPASSPQFYRQGQHQPQRKHQRFLQATTTARRRRGGSEGGSDDVDNNAENLEWYIQLASRCYTEGFLWHMNYLNGCSERQSALLHQRRQLTQQQNSRRLSSSISKSYKSDNHASQHRNCVSERNNPIYQNIYVQNYDSDATEENDNCKISININNSGRLCNPQQSSSTYNCSLDGYASGSRSIFTALEQQSNVRSHHIMNDNDSSRGIDAINNNKQQQHQQNTQHVAKLNEVIDNFCSLNISCDSGAYFLPQIILTDFTSAATINEQPKSTTVLLSQQQQQQHQTPGAFGLPITHESVNRGNSRATAAPASSSLNEQLCLSIPSHADKYVRSESRPP